MRSILRRDWILFRRGLIPAFLLSLLLGLASALAAYAVLQSAKENAPPVKVALVDEEGGLVSRVALNLVRSQSFIASLADMEPTKKEDAMAGLADGRYGAVIILPDGYTNHIRSGTVGSGQIILSRAAAASGDVVASLAGFGELLLASTQHGLFAGIQIMKEKGISGEFYQHYLDEGNDQLMDQAISIYDKGLKKEAAPYSGSGVSSGAYFAAAWISFFLLLSGLFFPALYTEDVKKPLVARLFSLSLTPGGFLSGKVLYPFLFRLPILMGILLLLDPHLPLQLKPFSLLLLLLALLMASLLISCASVALGQKKGWQGLLIGLTAIGLFLCGGLIPRSMLPAWITQLGRFTPFGAILSGLKPLWGGAADWPSLLAGLICTALVWGLALRQLQRLPGKGEAL